MPVAAAAERTYREVVVTPSQVRAGRALLNWKQKELAAAAGLSVQVIKNLERGTTDARGSTLRAVQQAFLRAGIVFIDDDQDSRGGGPGVRFLKRS